MSKTRRIKSVMTPFPHWIDADEPLLAARDLMQQHHVRHLPVKDKGRLVSVITDRDVKFATDPALGLPPRHALTVRDACVYTAYIVHLDTPLSDVLSEMASRRIGSVIVTRNDQLCGILTATDVCRIYGDEIRRREGTDDDPDVA